MTETFQNSYELKHLLLKGRLTESNEEGEK